MFLVLKGYPLTLKGRFKLTAFQWKKQFFTLKIIMLTLLFFSACNSPEEKTEPIVFPYDFFLGAKPKISQVNSLACQDGVTGQITSYFNQKEEEYLRGKVQKVSMEKQVKSAMNFHENKLKSEFKIINNRHSRNLERIFNKLVSVILEEFPNDTHPEYKIFLVKPKSGTKYYNAFTVGGGHVYFSQDMYDFCENNSQIAFICGHELGHLLLEHIGDANRRATIVKTALGDYADNWAATFTKMWDFVAKPINKLDESLCDYSGLYLMTKSGFDPKASQRLYYNFSKKFPNDKSIFRYGSSHPHSEVRGACVGSYLLEAEIKFQEKHQNY